VVEKMSPERNTIILYNPSLAEEAAVMFNAFNELWPGGFGGGVPYTAERVHDWLDKSTAVADLFAVNEDGELCGYCGLYPHWRDKQAAYISILGVTPKAKGKKFGKRLLLKALEIAEQKGITRVDLHTWSGNLDAVPLYKKVGLFWVPGTSVYMQDYIPGIKQNALAKEWFTKHPDWYGHFVRSLEQKPDKMLIDNMELYRYTFQVEKDLLEVEIDRFGWGICSIRSELAGKKLAFTTRLTSHDIFIGLPNRFSLEIVNEAHEQLEVQLNVQGFQGLHWEGTFPEKVTLKKGERKVLSCDFYLDKTASLFKESQRFCESIKTKISFEGHSFELLTSGKIQSPIKLREITTEQFLLVPKGVENAVHLDTINTTEQPVKGFLEIEVENKTIEKIPLELFAREISGCNFSHTIDPKDTEQCQILRVKPFLEGQKNQPIELPTFELPVFTRVANLLALAEIKDRNILYLATDQLVVRVNLEGGNIRICHGEQDGYVPLNHYSGPPYGISLDRTLRYHYTFQKDDSCLLVKLEAESLQVKGLHITKFLLLKTGTPEIEYWVEYSNSHQEKSIYVSARTGTLWQGISVNPHSAKIAAYVPIKEKIIETASFTNFLTDPLIPHDAQLWHESWSATKGLLTGDFSAWIWDPATIEKVKLNQGDLATLESKLMEIKPQETYQPVHLWHHFGLSSLQEVRRRWSQLVGNKDFSLEDTFVGPKITKVLDFKLRNTPLLIAGETTTVEFALHFMSNYPLPGELSLEQPQGWQAAFITPKGPQKKIPMPKVQFLTEEIIKVEVTPPVVQKTTVANLKMRFCGEFEITFDNYVLVIPKGSIAVKETKEEEKKLFSVSNGLLSFKVVAEIGGNLIRLEDQQGRQYLLDGFPEIKPKYFLDYYLGGLQPLIFHTLSRDEPFFELEECKTEPWKEGLWQGTRTTYTVKKDREFLQGANIELKYLTLPKSNIIRIILTLENKSPRVIPFIGTFLNDVGLQGTYEGSFIEVQGPEELWFHKAINQQFAAFNSPRKPFTRIFKRNEGKEEQAIAFLVAGKTKGTVITIDMGVMLLAWMYGIDNCQPHAKSTMEFAIILNDSRETIEKIRKGLCS